jgi:hypothetical protein
VQVSAPHRVFEPDRVRKMRMASLANTASKTPVNLLSRSRMKNLNRSRAVAEIHQQVACLLGDPGSGWVRGDTQQVHAAGGMLDDEQNVEPVPQQRVDAQEVRGENAVCLGAQEFGQLAPSRRGAGSMPARFRIDHTVQGASW